MKASPANHLTINAIKEWVKLLLLSLSRGKHIDNEALEIISSLPLREFVLISSHSVTEKGVELLKILSLEYLHLINCLLLGRRSEERIINSSGAIEKVQSLIISN
jgi:hypothetical protein